VVKHGKATTLDRINIGLPDEKLLKEYEDKKDVFLEKLGQDVLNKITPDVVEEKNTLTDEEIMKMVKKKLRGKEVSISKIRAIANISEFRARKIRAMCVV
jgi:hypothetical protein